MNTLTISALTLVAYLIGSIPFGLLIAKTKGLDIREQGSGNIGATNVLRCLGKPLGITCFILDVLKGYLPAALFPMFGTDCAELGILFGVAAILGHNFPIFLHFKGGKGVATTAGVLIGIAPLAVGLGILCWAIVFYASGYVSLGSIVASAVIILSGWLAGYGLITALALTLLGSLSIYRHRSNILQYSAATRWNRKSVPAKVKGQKVERLNVMEKIKSFEDLRIWQEARVLVREVYTDFKDSRDFGFRDQIQRAAVSIMNNTAEGFERRSDADFARFLDIAKGSSGEVRSMYYTFLKTPQKSVRNGHEAFRQESGHSRTIFVKRNPDLRLLTFRLLD